MTAVLFLTPWFPNVPGDREGNFIKESAEALAKAGHTVSVLVSRVWGAGLIARRKHASRSSKLRAEAFAGLHRVEAVRHLSIPRYKGLRLTAWDHDRRIGAALNRIIAEDRIDVIHAHTESEAALASRVGQQMGVRVVVTIHGINTAPAYFGTPFNRQRIVAGLKNADRVVLVGEPLRAFFRELLGAEENFRVVPNGIDPPQFQPRARFANDRPLIKFISVSNLHEGKGVDVALRALAMASERGFQGWTFDIVGDGSEKSELIRLTKTLGINEQVQFLGARPHSEIFGLLNAADVFVLPSYREAFGVAYLEAMAAGLLTIGVRGQGPSAFIESGKTGFLVESNDVEDLATCLLGIRSDPARMSRMALAGAAYVRSAWTWDAHAHRLNEVYGEVEAP